MVRRLNILLVGLLLLLPCSAKDKKKNSLPELILRAQYVAVIADPDAGIAVTDIGGNRTARSDVESALEKWGRFKVTTDTSNADLIVVLRKAAKKGIPTIGGGRPNDQSVVFDPSPNGDIRVGTTMGKAPRTSRSEDASNSAPTPRSEIAPAEDLFSVYAGHVEDPLDSPPLWRYAARNALQHPGVPAVDKFHQAIEDAEKSKP